MKKFLAINLLFFGLLLYGQDNFKTTFIDSSTIIAKSIFNIDTFETIYYSTEDNTFNKKTKDTTITYTNFQLSDITSANAFNPLKINIFYKDFNTVVILDNRLAEIFKIDFNINTPYKNVSYVSTGFDNTLWIFNQDLQQLELYDYKTNKIRFKTVPIQSEVIELKSDYNFCYLLTKAYLYVYNYFGSLVEKYPNTMYTAMSYSKGQLLLKHKENKLYVLPKNTNKISPVNTGDLLINQFLVTNESLYLYNGKTLSKYLLN